MAALRWTHTARTRTPNGGRGLVHILRHRGRANVPSHLTPVRTSPWHSPTRSLCALAEAPTGLPPLHPPPSQLRHARRLFASVRRPPVTPPRRRYEGSAEHEQRHSRCSGGSRRHRLRLRACVSVARVRRVCADASPLCEALADAQRGVAHGEVGEIGVLPVPAGGGEVRKAEASGVPSLFLDGNLAASRLPLKPLKEEHHVAARRQDGGVPWAGGCPHARDVREAEHRQLRHRVRLVLTIEIDVHVVRGLHLRQVRFLASVAALRGRSVQIRLRRSNSTRRPTLQSATPAPSRLLLALKMPHGSERTGGKYGNHRSKWSLPPPSDMVFITCEPTPKLATLASAQMTNQLMPCAAGQEDRLRPERRCRCGVSYVGGALPAIPYTAAHRPLRARPGGGL